MPSFINRLWFTSPASLTSALCRRMRRLREREEWQRVQAGPALSIELLVPVPLTSWALEMVNGTFDAFLYEVIRRHIKLDGARCWDIGAHVGYHSLALANQGAEVVAFEPVRANQTRLRLHMERNALLAPRIRVIPNAVADKDGEMTFVVSEEMKGESTGSHLATALPPLRAAVYANFKKQAVSTVTLDTLIQQQGERPPDVIKLDVEGAEHLVIRGGRTLLARYRPLLLVEVHHICAMFELALMLWELGYTLEIIERERAEPSRCFVCAFHP